MKILNKLSIACLTIFLGAVSTTTLYAGCANCPSAPGETGCTNTDYTWCCFGELSYPVKESSGGANTACHNNTYVDTIGTLGCAHGTAGCDAPCGC